MHHKPIVDIFNSSNFFLIKIIQVIKKILNFLRFVKSLFKFIILLLIETTVKKSTDFNKRK